MTPAHAPTASMFTSISEVEKFALAGNATMTVVSKLSGNRLTLKFRRPDAEPGKARPTWVNLTDPNNNESAGQFLGTVWGEHGNYSLRRSAKVKVGESAPSTQLLKWLLNVMNLSTSKAVEQAEFWHEGRCGRCGRLLTVPSSIESGIGPECSKHMGG